MESISLGYVTVSTPGTPVRLTNNQSSPTASLVGACGVVVLPGNAGKVYIGRQGMNKTTGVGVFVVLPAPGDEDTGPFASADWNGGDASKRYVDADQAGDGVVVQVLK